MTKEEIKKVLELGNDILAQVRHNTGEAGYLEFLRRREYYYMGLPVGNSLNDFLAHAIYDEWFKAEKEEYRKWYKEHFIMIKSRIEAGPRGDYYDYVECFDGKIFAVGEEQGNYAGGHVATMTFGGRESIKQHVEYFAKTERGLTLYDQIKDMPIITQEEYNQMKSQRMKWPRDFDFWNWFE